MALIVPDVKAWSLLTMNSWPSEAHSLLGFRKTFVHPHPSIFHDSDDHDGDDGNDAIHAIYEDHGDHATIHDVRDGGDDLL